MAVLAGAVGPAEGGSVHSDKWRTALMGLAEPLQC